MRCPSCLFDNPEGMKFCGRCAAPFVLPCPRCGFQSPPQFKFCGHCATPLTEAQLSEKETEMQEREHSTAPESPVPSHPTPHPPRLLPEAERRHLTIMFCDQVDSVRRSQRLDPEDFRTLTRHYQHLCAQIIREGDGHIAQYHGDGLLAYFGYPAAHEDDARRAIRAGLGIMSELPRLNAQLAQTLRDLQDFPLQLRIGIHSGVTVVGAIGTGERRELVALGETPNIAARLQGIASPNAVVISAYTYHLTAGFFECRELGPQQLKGITLPLSAYHVVQEGKAQSRSLLSCNSSCVFAARILHKRSSASLKLLYTAGIAGRLWAAYLRILWHGTSLAERAVAIGMNIGRSASVWDDIRSNDPRYTTMPEADKREILAWALAAAETLHKQKLSCLDPLLRVVIPVLRRGA